MSASVEKPGISFDAFAVADIEDTISCARRFLQSLYEVMTSQAAKSETAHANLAMYLHVCEKRAT